MLIQNLSAFCSCGSNRRHNKWALILEVVLCLTGEKPLPDHTIWQQRGCVGFSNTSSYMRFHERLICLACANVFVSNRKLREISRLGLSIQARAKNKWVYIRHKHIQGDPSTTLMANSSALFAISRHTVIAVSIHGVKELVCTVCPHDNGLAWTGSWANRANSQATCDLGHHDAYVAPLQCQTSYTLFCFVLVCSWYKMNF